MAWIGYWEYGGTEIVNVARTEAYAKSGGAGWFRPVYQNDSLALMLGEHYDNPLQDDAPWVDQDDPDSYDFWGAYPLSITGVEDSTWTAAVTESTKDGGVVGRVRHTTRSVVFSLALVGANQCAVQSGLRWLKAALGGQPCLGPVNTCGGQDLCFLRCEPSLQFDTTGTTEQYGSNLLTSNASSMETDISDWHVIGAQPPTINQGSGHAYDGSKALHIVWPTGTSSGVQHNQDGLIVGHTYEMSMRVWIPSGGSAPVMGQVAGLAITAVTSLRGQWSELHCRFVATATTAAINLIASGPTTAGQECWLDFVLLREVTTVPVETLPPTECLDGYLTSLREVTVITGPTLESESITTDGGCVWVVSFTAVAANPFKFSAEVPLIQGFMDPAVTVPYVGGVVPDGGSFDSDGFVETEVACPVQVYTPVVDPLCPQIVSPPGVPNVQLACFDFPVNYTRRQFVIPKQYVPLWGDVVPFIEITAATEDVRSLRLRFYANVTDSGDPSDDPCAFCGDIVFSYIPAGYTLVFDGSDQLCYVESANTGRRRADSLVFGSDGSPFEWPELSCGFAYIVTLDLPQTQTPPVVNLSLYSRAA